MSSKYQLILDKQKKATMAYGSMCLVFLLLIGAYSFFQWTKYQTYNDALALNLERASDLSETVSEIQAKYLEEKPAFEEMQVDLEDTLKGVFPIEENYTELTRDLDKFEARTHRPNNPFVISNLDYQDVKISENGYYKYLPLRMTITASPENFTKFLHYIETSGSLTGKVRLMDMQSIRLNFNEAKTDGPEIINFSVKINAYFQNI